LKVLNFILENILECLLMNSRKKYLILDTKLPETDYKRFMKIIFLLFFFIKIQVSNVQSYL
jgi:hypothetical protein